MKIAKINVDTDEIRFEQISHDSDFYLYGGRGLSSKIIHDEVPPFIICSCFIADCPYIMPPV